jgi:hypothetical protein
MATGSTDAHAPEAEACEFSLTATGAELDAAGAGRIASSSERLRSMSSTYFFLLWNHEIEISAEK